MGGVIGHALNIGNVVKILNFINNKTFRNYDEKKPMTLTGFDILIKANA